MAQTGAGACAELTFHPAIDGPLDESVGALHRGGVWRYDDDSFVGEVEEVERPRDLTTADVDEHVYGRDPREEGGEPFAARRFRSQDLRGAGDQLQAALVRLDEHLAGVGSFREQVAEREPGAFDPEVGVEPAPPRTRIKDHDRPPPAGEVDSHPRGEEAVAGP